MTVAAAVQGTAIVVAMDMTAGITTAFTPVAETVRGLLYNNRRPNCVFRAGW